MSAWTEAGPGLFVRRSAAWEMNSALLVARGQAVVVDPGVRPSELDDIARVTAEHAPRMEAVTLLFTHPHWDHVLGRPWFPGATTVGHVGFEDEVTRDAEKIDREARQCAESAGERWTRPFEPFAPDRRVRGTVQARLGPYDAVFHETHGHSSSQLATYLPESGVLLAADMLSDIEIPWLEAPSWIYRRGLTTLHWLFEQEDVRVLVPGHGPLAFGRIEGYRRLLRDIDYLVRLERSVRTLYERGATLDAAQDELASMDYLGKGAPYAMDEVHRGNVRHTWNGLVTLGGGEPDALA